MESAVSKMKTVKSDATIEIVASGGNAETRGQFISMAIHQMMQTGLEVRKVDRDDENHHAIMSIRYTALCEPDTPQ